MNNLNLQLQEAEINKFLQLTLKAYISLKKRGQDKVAIDVLRVGSDHAQFLMDFYGIKSQKVFCSSCGRQMTAGPDIESVNFAGECLGCDHIRHEEWLYYMQDGME